MRWGKRRIEPQRRKGRQGKMREEFEPPRRGGRGGRGEDKRKGRIIMRFSDLIRRINGISSPIFGVSWNPTEADRDIARRIIAFMEDRRVLYAPWDMEIPRACVESVNSIRGFLTHELMSLDSNKEIAEHLRAMRSACRKFLDRVERDIAILDFGHYRSHWSNWIFTDALGGLRATFGIHILQLAVKYGLDIEDDLASILPEEDVG
jgi:hypothetical protein